MWPQVKDELFEESRRLRDLSSSGGYEDRESLEILKQIAVYEAGRSGTVPVNSTWQAALRRVRNQKAREEAKLDPEYQEFQRLKEKFKSIP